MTPAEHRALSRAGILLLVSGAIRWGWEVHRGPPVLPPETPDEGPRLLAAAESLQAEEARRSAPLGEGERLDPNRAPAIELDRLPGVGPATAEAIVEARTERGGFRRAEDLLGVPGIGEATLEKMRAHLELDGTLPLDMPRGPPSRSERRASRGGDAASPGTELVDLNSADEEELATLPGVGPAIAARIVAARVERGGFRSVDDLLDVRGIGPATLERIRGRVVTR